MFAIIGVSMSAGARALAVMPYLAYSFAIDFISVMTPALQAAYAATLRRATGLARARADPDDPAVARLAHRRQRSPGGTGTRRSG